MLTSGTFPRNRAKKWRSPRALLAAGLRLVSIIIRQCVLYVKDFPIMRNDDHAANAF